ncbi:hypothetical protein HanRHA438_Chr04g0185411 [Helianthus annuus]|nr:hypothetical protein HanRHA438_Chr04g0185411 [Helianthus annuus]
MFIIESAIADNWKVASFLLVNGETIPFFCLNPSSQVVVASITELICTFASKKRLEL